MWRRGIATALGRPIVDLSPFRASYLFAATHSPQIIGETDSQDVIVLAQKEARPVSQALGLDSNAVLEQVMGVSARNERIDEEIRLIFKLIEAGTLEAAKVKIAKLEETLKGPTEPLVKALALIRRIEILANEE